MSVPADLLDEAGRTELPRFYGDVFGWQELPDRDRRPQEARLRRARDRAVRVPHRRRPADGVSAPRSLRAVGGDDRGARRRARRAAKAFREHDDRVDIIDKETTDHGMLKITSIYVGYLLPMMVEIQHWEFA